MLVARFLTRIGAPVERMMERAQLSPHAFAHPEGLIPFSSAARFTTHAARAEGIDDLGLRVASEMNIADIGTFGRLLAGPSTLHDAMHLAYRNWSFFNSGVRAGLTYDGDRAYLWQAFRGVDPADVPQWEGGVLGVYLRLIRTFDPSWRPTTIELTTSARLGWHRAPALADARIEYGQPALRIAIPARLLHRPSGPPRLPSPDDLERWQRSGPVRGYRGSVRQIVTALLADGYPDIRRVAHLAGTSTRTLQRRLGEEGLTYVRVVSQARLRLARRLLADPDRKIIDVALDLGYSDPAHFTRAFRGWTGVSPTEFRRVPADRPAAGT